jgi:hypothetical protein
MPGGGGVCSSGGSSSRSLAGRSGRRFGDDAIFAATI